MFEDIKYKVVKSYPLKVSTIEFWDNGIVFFNIQPNTEVDIDVSMGQYNALKENYIHGEKFYVLVEPGKFTTLTKEAREFSARPETNEMTKAIAVIIHSLAQRIIINFHSNYISRQKVKMKAFNSAKEGVEWLLKLKEAEKLKTKSSHTL